MKHTQAPFARDKDDTPYFSTIFGGEQGKKTTHTRRLLVDSRDRTDGTDYDFTVRFANPYVNTTGVSEMQNVSSVDLKLAAIPRVAGENYAIIDIAELRDSTLDATNNTANRAFAVAFFDNSLLSPGDVKPMKDFYTQKIVFNPPLNKLDRMTIRILKHDGSLVTRSDTGNVGNVSFLFDVELLK